jgi:3-deoxy-D-arabino-heptulosonate 7-phosphate (DAHP) synthase
MVEVHHEPEMALSDGQQALLPSQFTEMVEAILPILSEAQRARLLESRNQQAA